jgi:hypothetical protein
MNKKTLAYLIVGLFIGWLTVPLLQADNESNTYKALIHRIIGLMEDIKAIDQQTADNTKAIREKLGAK